MALHIALGGIKNGDLRRVKSSFKTRYGAVVGRLKPIKPSISLATIRSKIPELNWARYPRSITTPTSQIAEKIRRLISDRQRLGVVVTNSSFLPNCSLEELRAIALKAARSFPQTISATAKRTIRSDSVKFYALKRAGGRCENCLSNAPFINEKGEDYLEVHHTTRLSDGGPDSPINVIALCPNCHRKAHHAMNKKTFNESLKRKAKNLFHSSN